MNNFNFFKILSVKFIAVVVLCGLTFAPVTPVFMVHEAQAADTVFDPVNFVKNSITSAAALVSKAYNAVTAWATDALVLKAYTLDGIAWALINEILHQMSQSIISWINSGFQGSPAFVTDLQGFLLGVADKVAGDFIWGSNLNFLCSPFELDIRFALDLQYRKGRNHNSQCTLSGVVKNVENFMNGNFLEGGWDGWFGMTQNAYNNPYGALFMAQEELSGRLTNNRGQQIKLLDFGKGFFSKADGTGNITLPGAAIEAQLNNTLDSSQRRLQVADEINEIVASLFTQLVSQVFTGAKGLFGLTNPGYNGGAGSYYDALAATTQASMLGYKSLDIKMLTNSITFETEYLKLNQNIVTLIDDAEKYPGATYGTSTCDVPLPATLKIARDRAQDNIATSSISLINLTELERQFDIASGTPNGAKTQATIMNTYTEITMSKKVHTGADVEEMKVLTLPEIKDDITAFKNQVNMLCAPTP